MLLPGMRQRNQIVNKKAFKKSKQNSANYEVNSQAKANFAIRIFVKAF